MSVMHPNVRVLLIESDEVTIFVMEKTLGKHFHLTVARNGVEAIHFSHTKTFDLILSEIRLDHSMDGVEVIEELRKDSLHDSTEIWAITGVGLAEDEDYYQRLGFNRFYQKPIDPANLIAVIEETFSERVFC